MATKIPKGVYSNIYEDYKKYNKKALMESSVMQGITSSAELLYNNSLVNRLKSTPNKLVNPAVTKLQRSNKSPEMIKEIEKGLNTILSTSIEGNSTIDPQLLSRFADATLKAYSTDEAFNLDLLNKEVAMNTQSYQRAQEINANLNNDTIKRRDQLDMVKAQGKSSNLGRFNMGIANIFNNQSRSEAQLFSAQNQAVYSDMMRSLYGFNGNGEMASKFNPFVPIIVSGVNAGTANENMKTIWDSSFKYKKPAETELKPYE